MKSPSKSQFKFADTDYISVILNILTKILENI